MVPSKKLCRVQLPDVPLFLNYLKLSAASSMKLKQNFCNMLLQTFSTFSMYQFSNNVEVSCKAIWLPQFPIFDFVNLYTWRISLVTWYSRFQAPFSYPESIPCISTAKPQSFPQILIRNFLLSSNDFPPPQFGKQYNHFILSIPWETIFLCRANCSPRLWPSDIPWPKFSLCTLALSPNTQHISRMFLSTNPKTAKDTNRWSISHPQGKNSWEKLPCCMKIN